MAAEVARAGIRRELRDMGKREFHGHLDILIGRVIGEPSPVRERTSIGRLTACFVRLLGWVYCALGVFAAAAIAV